MSLVWTDHLPTPPKASRWVMDLLGDKCRCCGNRVIAATGPLLQGRHCGPCYTALHADDPAAA